MSETSAGPAVPGPLLPRGALGAWWAQGIRSAFLRRPHWQGLVVSPAVLIALWAVTVAVGIGAERLMTDGPARFYSPTLLSAGWMMLVLWLLLSWCLVGNKPADAAPPHQPLAVTALLCAQSLPLGVVMDLVLVPLARNGAYAEDSELLPLSRTVWTLGLLWMLAAQGLVLWHASHHRRRWRVCALVVLAATTLLLQRYAPLRHWYPERPEQAEDGRPPPFRLTQELVEAQSQVLARELQGLAPQRSGRIDVYSLTYAPYADEDVFLRESELVASLMRDRFDSGGRTVQLVSRRDEAPTKAWATPLNLQRAIERMAALMNRDEDVLLLHLTSHGGQDGELASSMWPLDVEPLTPGRLKAMLDGAGVRNRVVSVSACYAGSWIGPLAGDDTLVMTAADAEHTSYGCGRGSELTYFGRAVFGEQLRRTRSFEQAHAAARVVIEQREKKAGKTDGYSNPQIVVGGGARATLARLEQQLGGP